MNSPTAQFELFNNVTDLLEPVGVTLLFALIVGDHLHTKNNTNTMIQSRFPVQDAAVSERSGGPHQEGCPLKQKDFVRLYDLSKVPQVRLQLLDVGDELVHYARPGLQPHDKGLLTLSGLLLDI